MKLDGYHSKYEEGWNKGKQDVESKQYQKTKKYGAIV